MTYGHFKLAAKCGRLLKRREPKRRVRVRLDLFLNRFWFLRRRSTPDWFYFRTRSQVNSRNMSDLEGISRHFHDKLWSLQQMLDLSVMELPQNKMKKFGQELCGLEGLLEELETCVDEQKQQLKNLQEMQDVYQQALRDATHMKDNMPPHVPRKKSAVNGIEAGMKQKEGVDSQLAPAENLKKTSRSFIKEMAFITTPEFESIPQYMKGRVSYEQLNAAVSSMNAAATAKYKIFHQSVKGLNNHARKLHQRFKDQETKETKGQFFVVEEDIREFTQMKVDKRFQGILNMLRHCQRLRELRGGGLTRYLFL